MVTLFPELFTKDEIKNSLPDIKRGAVTDGLVDKINEICRSEEFHEDTYMDNFIDFAGILKGNNRFSVKQYTNAVRFTTLMLGGMTQQDAYERTFPEIKVRRLLAGSAESTFQSAATNYHKGQLVQKILAQSEIPMRLLYGKAKVDALNVLIDKSTSVAAGHRVNMESANMILTHLKDPDESKITLAHEMSEEGMDAIDSLKKATKELRDAQFDSIDKGTTIEEIALSTVVDVEVITE